MSEKSGGENAGTGAVGDEGVPEVVEADSLPAEARDWADSWFRLTIDYGEGVGMIPAGTHVLVLGVHPPGTAGIGAADDDSPLCLWLQQAPSGRWVPRHIHFTQEAFRQVFEPASEPPQWSRWLAQQEGGG